MSCMCGNMRVNDIMVISVACRRISTQTLRSSMNIRIFNSLHFCCNAYFFPRIFMLIFWDCFFGGEYCVFIHIRCHLVLALVFCFGAEHPHLEVSAFLIYFLHIFALYSWVSCVRTRMRIVDDDLSVFPVTFVDLIAAFSWEHLLLLFLASLI